MGYIYAHFKRESVDGEQIYFPLSNRNDPLHFDDFNGGKPVLYSTLGECGVRDPHIVRSPDGHHQVDKRAVMIVLEHTFP